MTELQRSILALSSALIILLAALIVRSTNNQSEKVHVAEATPRIEPSSACEKARTLATNFPERATGTEGARAAANWIESELKNLGLRTGTQNFEVWIAGKRVTGRNVLGIDEGIRDEVVVIIAHYDIPFHVREGAMDDAGGVGVLLELARVFSTEEQEKNLIFVASDAEEWGMLGARNFVKEFSSLQLLREGFRDLKWMRAVVSLDYVPLERPKEVFIDGTGQFRGFIPLWLWMLAEDCVVQAGGQPQSPGAVMQYISEAVDVSGTDQGPFLRRGIPGVNFGGSLSENPLERAVYHTPEDTSENLKPWLFDTYGKSAELMIRSLDALDYSTDNNPYYLRTGKRRYVGRVGLLTLQMLAFFPLLLGTIFQYYNLRNRENLLGDAFREIIKFILFVMPWVFALIVLYILVYKNIIPKYELYPATPLDPLLKTPNWRAVAIVGAVFVAGWCAALFLSRLLSSSRKENFAISKAVCLDTLLTLSIVALFFNGFAASLFLAPAAFAWVWIEQNARVGGRIANVILAIAPALPAFLLVATFSSRLMLGPFVFWYFLLGVGYRFFSPVAVLIAIGAVTAGGRILLKSFIVHKEDSPAEVGSK